jgi:DNA-binding response OmpR family regulator
MEKTIKILAVDNEPSVTTSLSYVFGGPRYEMTTVASGLDALARLDTSPDTFDVIIVDQKMPNLTGVELVTAIRARGVTGKIIVLSAHLSPEIRAAYEEMDVHSMFTKPFDISELRAAAAALAA